jgi:Zn ribbon nucleic-acid-binding protein
MAEIKLTLLDNGIDYIYEAVKTIFREKFNLRNNSNHSWKYSVLHLYSGIELLLKEKLKRQHWSLIFQDINVASSIKLENGDFVSVSHEDLIKRLQNISGITLNDKPIQKLRSLRNKFEHFEINISLSECQDTVAAALDEIIKFWEKHLKPISVEQKKKFKEIKLIATKLEVYKKHRLNKFKQAISGIVESKKGLIILCPNCSSLSFAVFKDDEKKAKCFVCGKEYTKHDYLKKIRKREEDNKNYSFLPWELYDTTCSFCQQETRIRLVMSDEITLYYCLNCLNEEKSIKEKGYSKVKEDYARLENATNEEFFKALAERNTLEELEKIYQLFQNSKKIDNKLEKD